MILVKRFEKSGGWLFKWRSFIPLILVCLCIVSLRNFVYLDHSETWDAIWEAICLSVSFLGLGIRVFTIGHTPRNTSGRNTECQMADELNTTGAYSIVRNPLYLGNFFMALGLSMFPHTWWLVLVYTLTFWLYYERIIIAEEAYLVEKFGHTYIEWAERTPAFIPDLSRYERANLPFSLKNVLRREYNSLLLIILSMFILEVIGDLFYLGRFEFDLGWKVLVGLGFLVWATLRTLNKHTKRLYVQGR